MKDIIIKGAREHNLKNVDLTIPRDKLIVFTGLSGSGKSSLAFDTIYAEGQRRYVESLSAYARQFLGQMEKPDMDSIDGLSPAISIDQKTTSKNPRSTVGTVTEIYDYFRLLFARVGTPHCPNCDKPIAQQTISQMVDQAMTLPDRTKVQVLAPVVRGRKGQHIKLLEKLKKSGYVRVKIDDHVYHLDEEIKLEKNKKHTIEVVVDRIVIKEGIENRLADSLETSLALGEGIAILDVVDGEKISFSENFACLECGFSFQEISPRMFSFNNPFGACPGCSGLGSHLDPDPDLIIKDKNLSIAEGAIVPWSRSSSGYYGEVLRVLAMEHDFDLRMPVKDLPKEIINILLYGTGSQRYNIKYVGASGEENELNVPFRGLVNWVKARYNETSSDYIRNDLEGYMSQNSCENCGGARLKPEALAVKVGGINIAELTGLSVKDAKGFFDNIEFTEKQMMIGKMILKEINERLGFLIDVGLDYLTLDRSAGTLSGGEAQRIRLATQIGSSLMGVLYILDEPSIGLHQRDNQRLLDTLKRLRDLGNTLIVVEHDEDTIKAADHIVDIGPYAGAHGGEIVAQGDINDIMAEKKSITGQYLTGEKEIVVPDKRRKPNGKWLEVEGAAENNLKDVDVKIPLGVFTCVTGVSGSGKSTLINEILYKTLAQKINKARSKPGKHKTVKGIENVEKIIDIDQSPIGRTPRSNPATYTGVFDHIRELFSKTQDALAKGYKPGRFSFNVKGGRCEACRGDGIIKIEMHFLPDVYVPCEVCKGARYNRETLEVRYKGKTIADILALPVSEAITFFENIPKIKRKLDTLYDVGLGYIKLGQPATTLSGGEAQRVKLATHLSKRSNGKTLYILDEPTTGLHIADIDRLLRVLNRLVENGDSVLVIEHNLDVIKTADYIVDLGPEGGHRGGEVIAKGTPEEICKEQRSHTAKYLKPYVNNS
ncbi:excinuclease ABC subunit UvrA [Proteinivorax hydrogeniformans]|uniref:UvrABC system protein A n=1 Tax=Proteinivorax hydrogeniformans TaxID=1826727 RepID=A0AAU8HUY3_9FIRM